MTPDVRAREAVAILGPQLTGRGQPTNDIECIAAYFDHMHEFHRTHRGYGFALQTLNIPVPRNEYAQSWPRDLARLAKRLDGELRCFETLGEVVEKIGLPYERFFPCAIETRFKVWEHKKNHWFPRPNQLYTPKIIEAAIERAEEWRKEDEITKNTRRYCYGHGYQPPTFLRPPDYGIRKYAGKFINNAPNRCDGCDLWARCSRLTASRHGAEDNAEAHGSAKAAIASGEVLRGRTEGAATARL